LTHSFAVSRTLGDGSWKGLSLSGGIRKQTIARNSKLFMFMGVDYKTPGGIKIKIRLTRPNISPPPQTQVQLPLRAGWYDEFFEARYDYANVVLLTLNSSF
jgi:hypothetical protein